MGRGPAAGANEDSRSHEERCHGRQDRHEPANREWLGVEQASDKRQSEQLDCRRCNEHPGDCRDIVC